MRPIESKTGNKRATNSNPLDFCQKTPGQARDFLLLGGEFGERAGLAFAGWLVYHGRQIPDYLIRSRRDSREKIFWLNAGDWKFLIHPYRDSAPPRWVDWMPVFSAITTFITALGEPGLDDAPEQVQSIQLRQALDAAMPALARAGLAETLTAYRKLTGSQLISAIHEDLEFLMGNLK